ncbi:PREDICTED: uncharacterized protein LOC109170994 [Ipomoea nil]|uniref:uncharacterized protein LOC109170994 n=1 Tax=Ipomoea nil TaxID=35883 RepID=UPI000901AE10|nr:PREDICTED: uncharacterized protein LOC109170994 [Ipomoea nil]
MAIRRSIIISPVLSWKQTLICWKDEMDAKDILGLPKNSLSIPSEKKSRPPKESQRKPDGISREVYALTGGLAPLMPATDINHLKRRTQAENEKITWQWLPFTNSARNDSLQLYHWVRVVNGVLPTGDYSFAKYNNSVDVIEYTNEKYEKYLTDPCGDVNAPCSVMESSHSEIPKSSRNERNRKELIPALWPPLIEFMAQTKRALRLTSVKREEESTSHHRRFEQTKRKLYDHAKPLGIEKNKENMQKEKNG